MLPIGSQTELKKNVKRLQHKNHVNRLKTKKFKKEITEKSFCAQI